MNLKYGKVKSKLYNCDFCTKDLKRKRNCRDLKRKKAVDTFSCICKGKEKKCDICKGSGTFKVYSCPDKLIEDYSIERIYFYYNNWLNSNRFPNDRGMYYQCNKMIEAFDLLNKLYLLYNDKKEENKNGITKS